MYRLVRIIIHIAQSIQHAVQSDLAFITYKKDAHHSPVSLCYAIDVKLSPLGIHLGLLYSET